MGHAARGSRRAAQTVLAALLCSSALMMTLPASATTALAEDRGPNYSGSDEAKDKQKPESEKAESEKSDSKKSGSKKSAAKKDAKKDEKSQLDDVIENVDVSLRVDTNDASLKGFRLTDASNQAASAIGVSGLSTNTFLDADGQLGRPKLGVGSDTAIIDVLNRPGGLTLVLESSQEITSPFAANSNDIAVAGQNGSLVGYGRNVSLTVGYAGFNFDAQLIKNNDPIFGQSIGIEAGLSFQSNAFTARLSARQYREGGDLFGLDNQFRDLVSYELGARYKLSDRIGLSAGARYSDFGTQWLVDPRLGANSQVIYVGGSLRF